MRMRFFLPNPIKTLIAATSSPPSSFRLLSSLRSCRFDSALTRNHTTLRSPIGRRMTSIAASVNNESGLARRFWIKFTRESVFAMYTPFVIALASGNLHIDSFRHYIAQDVHFLRAFAQASVSISLSFFLRNLVKRELKLSRAMTPCMRLYAFLGNKFQELLDSDESTHPYKKWIDNYASDGFQASALQTEDLLDKLSVSLTGEELDVIEKLYYQAMKLEIDFFSAQPLFQPTILPLTKGHNPTKDHLVIFSDFDLTCTVVDSSAILAEIAIVTAPKSDQNQTEDQMVRLSSSDLRNTWGFLSKQYTEEYEQCIELIMPANKLDNFDYKELSTALEQLSKFENTANNRVIESGVLKGINLEDIKRAGERLILQDGCSNFFQRIVKNENLNAKVHVLSYCWCGDLIRSAFSSADLKELDIHANEFTYEGSVSSGEILKKVESPIDKVQAFRNILKNSNDDKKKLTVYIGDSVGDLLCLLEADIGIVIGSSSSLRSVGAQFGVTFVPLFSGLVKKQKEYNEESCSNWKGLSGILYTVSSWAEVHAFILGC
ncbi:hypothetical protein Ahy_B09g096916 isoform C [Arachis hypogaea]|uniref:Thiaminase-2/PQQC domain-containing protein n=1 Tax=Arachis hypogaea TaxID=3818 RepID=A0A444XMZ8_ARAHY|nr:hypothetical protein Ahy_B09g096916 isoform C [Arachis hypogaea]